MRASITISDRQLELFGSGLKSLAQNLHTLSELVKKEAAMRQVRGLVLRDIVTSESNQVAERL